MSTPTVGRIVHFVTKFSEVRPAVVLEVHGPEHVDLEVFLKPGDHEARYQPLVRFSVLGECATWHWPDRTIPPAASAECPK